LSASNYGSLTLLIIALALALLTYRLVRKNLRDLLSRTLTIPGGSAFYLRSFLLLLILGAASAAFGERVDLKPSAPFMENVWAIAAVLADTFGYVFITLAIYVVLITILVSALKPPNDK
jgi:hypothetical protein